MNNPFRYFNSSPEVIRLAVMMYIRYPLSLRQVEDILFERGIDICHETVRYWWNRFGPMFAGEIRKRRVHGGNWSNWRWHLDEVFVRINGETHYLVPVRKVGISGIGAGGKRPRGISQEAVRRARKSSRPLRASTDRSLPRPRGSGAAAGPPLASRRARSGAGCCNRSGAMADSGLRPAWDAGEPGASGCGRTPPIGRRP